MVIVMIAKGSGYDKSFYKWHAPNIGRFYPIAWGTEVYGNGTDYWLRVWKLQVRFHR
jgi:hypothetical protein